MANNIIGDVIAADQVSGNPNLGGALNTSIKIDTNPLFQLGYYTQAYNKTLYDQNIADTNTKIAQVSKLADIDLNNLLPKDRPQVQKQLESAKQFAVEYAKKPDISVSDTLAWQTVLQGLNDNYNSGKQRALSYHKQVDMINGQDEDASVKDIRVKSLQKKVDDTDITTPIPIVGDYKPTTIDIPEPKTSAFSTVSVEPDNNYEVTGTYYNPYINSQASTQASLGLGHLQNKSDIADGEQSQLQGDIQDTGIQDSKAKAASDTAGVFNSVLLSKNTDGSFKYFNTDGSFNTNKFETDNSSNSTIMNAYNSLNQMSKYSTTKKNQVTAGVFTDHGINYPVPAGVTSDQFDAGIVNFTQNGIKPEQLIQAGTYAKYTGDAFKKELKHTGDANAIKKDKITQSAETQRTRIVQANENFRAKLPYEQIKLTASKDSKPVSQQEFNPFASIIAAVGGLNRKIPIEKLSKAQIASINPEWIDKDNDITEDAKGQYISVGKNDNGDYGVYIVDKDGKSSDRIVGESALKSNASSWLTTYGKETKGQDAYQYNADAFTKAFNTNDLTPAKNETKSKNQKVDEYGVPIQ